MRAKVLLTAAYVAIYGYCTTLPGFERVAPATFVGELPTTTVVAHDPVAWYAATRAAEAVSQREAAIDRVIAHEGGYANNHRDPGGPTRYGITIRTARRFGYTGRMDRLDADAARRMYRELWRESGAGRLEGAELQFQAFDAFVNHGPRAKVWADNAMATGPGACQSLNAQRMRAYRASPRWKTFGAGWSARVAENLTHCA